MGKKFLLMLAMLPFQYIFAQANTRDSLTKALRNERSDTGRVLLLSELSFTLFELDPDTAMILAMQGLDLSRRSGFEKGEAICLNRIGNALNSLGNFPKAMEVYLEALKINEKIKNYDGERRNLNNIGTIYRDQQIDYHRALEYFNKAKVLGEHLPDKRSHAITLTNMGECYLLLKKYDSAIYYVRQGFDLARSINYSRIIGQALNDMATINAETGNDQIAIEYFRESFPYYEKAGNLEGLSVSWLGMAAVFDKLHKRDSALLYARKAFRVSNETGFMQEAKDAAVLLSFYHRKINADSSYFYQDLARKANDSISGQQKQSQFQSLVFDEKLRQQELQEAEIKAKEKRKNNIQNAGIAVGLITFIILFLLLSHTIIVNQKIIRLLGVIALLLVFEFIGLLIDPMLGSLTHHAPVYMLIAMVITAAILVPIHHRIEHWIIHKLIEKNNRIRLAAEHKVAIRQKRKSI
jgi:tetratricopeptide (TPR) repeat protein